MNFAQLVEEKLKEIRKEIFLKEDIIKKILALLIAIKYKKFPGKKPPKGILFYGPPGTGKTLLMKTIISKLNLSDPLIIRGPEIISQYYGKSESKLRQIFFRAKEKANEEGLSVIFIDEIDSLVPRRDITRGELEQRLVGQFLSLLDGIEKDSKSKEGHVVIIGSTNRPEMLDPAIRRPGRFDIEIEFEPPNVIERKEILKILLEKNISNNYNSSIDLQNIAEKTIGFTGADLLQVINEALLKVLMDGKDLITEEDLLQAVNNVKPSALREFIIEYPRNKINEIKNEDIINRIFDITEDFIHNPRFKAILLKYDLLLSKKIVHSIAGIIHEKVNYPYIEINCVSLKSKWFGETEKSIRNIFEKISKTQPCVIYFKYIDAISKYEDKHLYSAILELINSLTEFYEKDIKVLILASAKNIRDIDKEVYSFFNTFLD